MQYMCTQETLGAYKRPNLDYCEVMYPSISQRVGFVAMHMEYMARPEIFGGCIPIINRTRGVHYAPDEVYVYVLPISGGGGTPRNHLTLGASYLAHAIYTHSLYFSWSVYP